MAVGHGGNLRQVGNADNLMAPGDYTKLFRNHLGRPAADPGINFIKNQGGNIICLGQHRFHRQHDARQLTAGGNHAERSDRLSRIGGDHKFRFIVTGRSKMA